ncbi:MAG: glycosyltransferase [Anderseniella sp.]|jgi:glycosyltransferase involved in cell wall biosynthesis|nr:glycosyltransferase [Anderseniella sp.]
MDFSVIVCTYNRANNLPRCLGALARQNGTENMDWEVLVVDNNSSDGTQAMVERLAQELPITIRYARETQQGLNYARNTGIRESKGTYFSYVDDDIEVSPDWLASLYRNFIANDADAVGGRIHLDPSITLPKWIQDVETKGFLGFQDFGDEAFRMDGKRRYPYGGNMAFNRRVVERIGYFNPLLGRKGEGKKRSELFKGAETDYFHRLADSGEVRIFYEPNAIVYHQVQPFQLEKKYFRTIHSNAGYQRAYYDDKEFPHTIFGVPRYLYPMLLSNVGEYLRQLILKGPDTAFRQQMTVGHMIGTMLGYHRRPQRGSQQ